MIEWSLTFFYFLVFSFIIFKHPFFNDVLSKRIILLLFIIKIIAGYSLYLIYTQFYPDRCNADIFKYFDDSKVMYNAIFTKPLDYLKMMTGIANDNFYFNHTYYYKMNNWFRLFDSSALNDNHIIIRLNAFFHLFSFGFYQVHNVFMNFLSLTGLVALYKAFYKLLPTQKYSLLVVIFLIPSTLLWSSGVLKEGLLMLGLGFLMLSFFSLTNYTFHFKNLMVLLISLLILLNIKIYIISLLFPLLLIYYWTTKYPRNVFLKYISGGAICLVLAIVIGYLFPNYNLIALSQVKQQSFINIAITMNAGSYIQPPLITTHPWQWIGMICIGFYNTLIMPLFYFKTNILMLFNAIENAFLLLFIVIAIIKLFRNQTRINNLFWLSFFFVLLSFTLIGIITPVMGAIVRYRIPALPFLGILIIMLLNTQKFEKKTERVMYKLHLER